VVGGDLGVVVHVGDDHRLGLAGAGRVVLTGAPYLKVGTQNVRV
jgi:hypothetical protein